MYVCRQGGRGGSELRMSTTFIMTSVLPEVCSAITHVLVSFHKFSTKGCFLVYSTKGEDGQLNLSVVFAREGIAQIFKN